MKWPVRNASAPDRSRAYPGASLALALALLSGACSVGPDYRPAELHAPAAFKEAGDWQTARPADDLPKGAWWQVLGDPVLNDLASQLEQGNLSLQNAQAQYRQARSLADLSKAAQWPGVNAGVSDSRAVTASAAGKSGAVSTDHLAGLSLSWEVDLWGRVSRQVEAGAASEAAAAADLANVRLALQAELAKDYILLRIADEQRALLGEAVSAYEKSLDLTRHRQRLGVATRLDVAQAETQLKSTRAQWVDLEVQRRQLEHAIAVLLGHAPANFNLPAQPLKLRLAQVPSGLPSTLVQRRSDVAAAERRAAAAHAQIGIARAAWFPSFTLGAALGSESASLNKWFTAPARYWSLGPSLALSLFDGGARSARQAQAEAAADGAVAIHRQTALQAFQEVEDALASIRILEQEAAIQAQAVAAARETEELTRSLYRLGSVTYLNVVSAQTTALSNERTARDLLARRLLANVALIKALGGSW